MPSPPESCLFCRLVEEGDHVHAADGFVAIRDLNPMAKTRTLLFLYFLVVSARCAGTSDHVPSSFLPCSRTVSPPFFFSSSSS